MFRQIIVLILCAPLLAFAQSGTVQATVVTSCGTASYSAGQTKAITQDVNGNQCINPNGSSSGGGSNTNLTDINGTAISPTNGLPVTTTTAATTTGSGTITTGGTFQTVLASSTTRKFWEFQNICNISGNCTATTDICYLYVASSGSGAVTNTINVGPGGAYRESSGVIASDAVSATCTSTGDHFYLGSR